MATQPVLVDLDFGGIAKITGLQNGVAATDAVNLSQLNSAIEGLSWKDNCRAATTANVTISNPGTAIFDGITLVANDRLLVKNQTTTTENGIYIFNGSGVALTRANDCSTFDELEAAVTTVDEGTTNAGTSWRQTQVNGVVGTNNIVWASFGTSAAAASETVAGLAEIATQAETDAGTDDLRIVTPLKLKTSPFSRRSFSQLIGDASSTSITVTHNLGSQDVGVTVREATGSFREVICEIRRATTNTVVLLFNTAPATNAYRAIINLEG